MEPADVGECFESPPSSITEIEKRTDEKIWELQKEKRNTLENLLMVLTKTFEDVIDPAFHTGSRGLATRGFGNTKPYDVLAHIWQTKFNGVRRRTIAPQRTYEPQSPH